MLRRSTQPNSRGQDAAQFQSYNFSKGIRRTDNPSALNSGHLIKNFEIEEDGTLSLRKPLFLKNDPKLTSANGTLLKVIYPFSNRDEDIIYITTNGFYDRALGRVVPYYLDEFNNKVYIDANNTIIEYVDFANFNTATIISGVQFRENLSAPYKYRFLRLTYNDITNLPELEILAPYIPTTGNFTAGDFNYYADVLQSLRDDYLSRISLVNVIHQYALYLPVGNKALTVKDLTRNEPGIERWRMFQAVVPGTEVYIKAFFNLKREDMHRYYCAWEYTEDGINWFTCPEFEQKFSTGEPGTETTSLREMSRLDKTLIKITNSQGELVDKEETKETKVKVVPFVAYSDNDLITDRPDILFITADNVTRRFSIYVLESPEEYEKYDGANEEHKNWRMLNKGLIRTYAPTTSLVIQSTTMNEETNTLNPASYKFAKTMVNGSEQIQGETGSASNIFYHTPTSGEYNKLYSILVEINLNKDWIYDNLYGNNGDSEVFIKIKGGYIRNNTNYEFDEEDLYARPIDANPSTPVPEGPLTGADFYLNDELYYFNASPDNKANDLLLGEYSDNSELVFVQESAMGVWIDLEPSTTRITDPSTLAGKLPIKHVGDLNAAKNVSYFAPYYTILNKNRYNYVYLPTLTFSLSAASVREYFKTVIQKELSKDLDNNDNINYVDRTFENFVKNMDNSDDNPKKMYIQIPLYSVNPFKFESNMQYTVTLPEVEIFTESVKVPTAEEEETENKPLDLIVLSELEHTVALDELNDIVESELKYPASARRILNYNKSIYAYNGEGFENNIVVSGADDMLFPISNLLDLDSRENVKVNAVIPWRNYLLVATENAIYLVTKVEDGFVNRAVNTFIGLNEKDGPTFKAILNGTILKSGRKIFSLTPNPASSDDSILNIQELGSQLTDLIPESNFTSFGYTTEKYYGVFIKVARGANPKTLLFKYYYTYKTWIMHEFPIDLIQIHFPTINEVILTDINGKEYYLDKGRIDFFDIFKYGDALNNTQESLATLAETRRTLTNENDIINFDTTYANTILPFEFILDSGEKATDYLYNKYYLESKFAVATLENTKGYFPVNVEIYMDGIKSVLNQDVKSSSNFWATDQNTLATLSTTSLASVTSNLANIVKTLTIRHSGKGKSIRHVVSGHSLNYFKFLQVFYKYRYLPGQN